MDRDEVEDLLYGIKHQTISRIRIPSGQDSSILPARVANHSMRFGSVLPARGASHIMIMVIACSCHLQEWLTPRGYLDLKATSSHSLDWSYTDDLIIRTFIVPCCCKVFFCIVVFAAVAVAVIKFVFLKIVRSPFPSRSFRSARRTLSFCFHQQSS